jgi:hypothetical protein
MLPEKTPSVNKIFYVLAVGLCLLAACSKSSSNTKEKLIAKVKAQTPGCLCEPYLRKYQWKGRIVYLWYMSGPACNGIPVYYNSSGERIELPGRTTLDVFFNESKFLEEVWTCK